MKKMIFSYKGKAKDLVNEIKKQRNEKTLEEIAEEKREELYENDMNYYLDHYIEDEDL